MNTPKITNRHLIHLVTTYWQWRVVWVSSAVAFGLLGLLYVLFLKQDVWVASQGIIIRDEANGAVMRLGRFESQTAMKAAQETVLEMARNSQVLGDALTKVGREPSWLGWGDNDSPPTNAEIESLAKDGIEVRAPRGAELGTTEVVYLDVKQNSRERAVKLNEAVCSALEDRLKQVREARANGVISELLAAKAAASVNLQRATERLRKMEEGAGADLSDLRGMTDALAGGSSTRTALDASKQELIKAELARQQIEADLETAKATFNAPDQLLLTPTELVNAHPGLKRLREGLAAASIRSSELLGRYTETHPLVIASRATEERIRQQLRKELGISVETLTKDLEIATGRVRKLNEQQESFEGRIANLALIRADYSNVASEVRARNEQLQEAERELAQAEAARDAAKTSSLITRLDEPLLGENPVGPGRSTILAGVTISGLFFGFGVVFLLSPMDGNINYGRRKLDYTGASGRRDSDAPPESRPAQQASAHGSMAQPASTSAATTPTTTQAAPSPAEVARAQTSMASIAQQAPTPSQSKPATKTIEPYGASPTSQVAHAAAEAGAMPEPKNLQDQVRPRTITEAIALSAQSQQSQVPLTSKSLPMSALAAEAPQTISGGGAVTELFGPVGGGAEPMMSTQGQSDVSPSPGHSSPSSPAASSAQANSSVQANSTAPAAVNAESQSGDQQSLEAAQAVIAAALQCSFSEEATAPPTQQ